MWILGGIVVLQVTGSAERGDAHPRAAVYNNLQPFCKSMKRGREREKKRERESVSGGRGE